MSRPGVPKRRMDMPVTTKRMDMPVTAKRRGTVARVAGWGEERLRVAGPMRKYLNKVFPDHWSFMMGEIALYSFIVLLITGTYLTFFFDPSMVRTTYHGSYVPLQNVEMSR